MDAKILLNEQIAKLDEEIEKIEEQIAALQEQLEPFQDKKYELERQLKQMEWKDNTRKCVNQIRKVTPKNSAYVQLFSDTKTTPIMDAFYNSKDRFLIFKRIYTIGWHSISLVVVRNRYHDIIVRDNDLTMTALKKSAGTSIINREYPSGDIRSELFNEILQIDPKKIYEGMKIPFHIPCHLGGQTYANQTGYGSEYEGDYLVYEGTLYGEVTDFLIIGIIVED